MDKLKNYLQDTVILIKESAVEATNDAYAAKETEDYDFKLGYSFGFYYVMTLLRSQAQAFDIPLSTLKLDDIDLEEELLVYYNQNQTD